jgi:hypothetical protein
MAWAPATCLSLMARRPELVACLLHWISPRRVSPLSGRVSPCGVGVSPRYARGHVCCSCRARLRRRHNLPPTLKSS